jgi:DNA polymerase-3 subunit delta
MAKRAAASSSTRSKPLSADMRVVLLRGPELFLHAQYTRRLVELLRSEFREIEQFRFDGDTITLAEVLDELRTYGLMQHHKLVILDNADQFLATKKKTGDDNEGDGEELPSPNRAAMERYVESPVDNATLLLRAETWRPGRIDKIIDKVGTILRCEELSPADTIVAAVERAQREYNVTLSPQAATLLVDRIGTSLAHIDTELARLSAYVGDNGAITPQVIRDFVEPSREEQAWVIQEAVLTGKPGHALTRLTELLEISRQPKELLFWSVTDLLRKLYHASRMTQAGAHPGQVASALKLWGDSRHMILNAATRVQPSRFAQLLHEALASDWRMKTGQRDPIRTLEGLVVRVADSIGA